MPKQQTSRASVPTSGFHPTRPRVAKPNFISEELIDTIVTAQVPLMRGERRPQASSSSRTPASLQTDYQQDNYSAIMHKVGMKGLAEALNAISIIIVNSSVVRGTVTVVGGAAMVFYYKCPRETNDIDIVYTKTSATQVLSLFIESPLFTVDERTGLVHYRYRRGLLVNIEVCEENVRCFHRLESGYSLNQYAGLRFATDDDMVLLKANAIIDRVDSHCEVLLI